MDSVSGDFTGGKATGSFVVLEATRGQEEEGPCLLAAVALWECQPGP